MASKTFPADYSGYLKKKGGKFKAYKKRWFEIRGKLFYYFKNPNTKPAGVIDLTGCKVEIDVHKKLQLNISGPYLSRVYEIQADNEPELNTWIQQLNKAISSTPKDPENGTKSSAPKQQTTNTSNSLTVADDNKDKDSIGLKDFDLLTVIGRGSFGKVMKVRKKDSKEIYAMKVLRKDMIIKENMVQHTRSENLILQKIKHPFIVNLRFAFQTADKLYLILDFLSGGELFFHLKEESKFTEERARFYAAEIVLAIEHLHKNDIVYRDLKPENCVLDKNGHVCLTDFGLAKTAISNATPTYTFCGTPEYLAPEILKGHGHANAVDWWSLGVLLYEMLVGLPPFYSENINEMYELILKAPLKFPSFVSPSAQGLLKGLLERDETKRYGSGPNGADIIRSHPFFSSINWDDLYNRRITPPFIPQLQDEGDTTYFDTEFTQERAQDSFCVNTAPNTSGNEFVDFSYNEKSALKK